MGKIVYLYLCDRAIMDCKDSPGCSNEGGPCYCTTDKNHAQLQKNGNPIIIDFRCDDIEEEIRKWQTM